MVETSFFRTVCRLAAAGCLVVAPQISAAQVTPFKLAVAEAAGDDAALSTFYREGEYEAIWTDDAADDAARRNAFVTALARADAHALPTGHYRPGDVREILGGIAGEGDRARAEVELSRLYLDYAHDLQSGILDPDSIDPGIKREAPRRDGAELLTELLQGDAAAVLRELAPSTPEYARLMRKRVELQRTVAAGGWGATVGGSRYDPGEGGPGVAALRDRLAAMGYLDRTQSDVYDTEVEDAVLRFQSDNGLLEDGIAGPQTLEAINIPAAERLGQVIVAMERERWTNIDRGARHVWVNLADFSASIIDDGKVTFQTRAVVGATPSDRRSPEFSDQMEHMVINPTWHVPRSIAVNEYLPDFRRNPYAHGQLQIHYKGQVIARERINWPAVTVANFPFMLKQPPSRSNALGLVKFMFPNRWNIYLHDSPAEHLFERNTRAYSHGCIRLQEPFEFAYTLLAPQTDDPEGFFAARRNTGRETTVSLDQHVPVHLVYRTAFTTPTGEVQFRPDIYGRDRRILEALREAGVEIAAGSS